MSQHHEKNASLWEMFSSFFRIGAFTFGGGFAMLPLVEQEVIDRRGWVDREEILDMYALAQSVPGVIAVNTAMLIGYRLRGLQGIITAAIGVISPSLIIITLIAKYFDTIMTNPVATKAMGGIRGAVAALILTAAIRIGRRALTDPITLGIGLLSFWLVTATSINVVFIFLITGWLGYTIKLGFGAHLMAQYSKRKGA
jgi:chromate transporter